VFVPQKISEFFIQSFFDTEYFVVRLHQNKLEVFNFKPSLVLADKEVTYLSEVHYASQLYWQVSKPNKQIFSEANIYFSTGNTLA
jgi:hypothetical protein